MVQPTLIDKLLLALLLLASISIFFFRIRPILSNILRSKRDADFRLTSIGRRIRDLVAEVLLQGRVIGQRPLPGVAHALVFWGFCAFALVTLNHFAAGFGLGSISMDGAFGRVYFGFVFVFALAVAIAIAGLAFRRFVIRPKWLGKLSPESGLIAFLIFLLMVTYLAEYLVRDQGPFSLVNWWCHILAVLVFLPIIPQTKHFHLVVSPLTIFLSRGGFSKIPPLADDEDFGLCTGKDVTRIAALQAYSCVECGRCTEHCPAYNTDKTLNPKEIALGFRNYLNQFGPGSEERLLGVHLSRKAAFQCTTCGACEYQCPVGVEHLPLIVGLRRGSVNTGEWEDEYGTKLFLNLERQGNPLGLSSTERDKFIKKHSIPLYDGTQQYLLWLGCMGAYDPQGREIVLALIKVLRHLGITFGVLKKERCTGDSARRLGNDLAFQELAEANIRELRNAGAKKLLSICPHCVRTIREDWKEFDGAFDIEHHSVLLARHQNRLPAGNGAPQKVVFHDPCYLGRYQGIYDEPRTAAAAGGQLVEAHRARERSFCCGAGGGLVFLGEEEGKRVSHERAEQLVATGADVIAAACPFCNTMFRDALPAVSERPPELMDIAQIAAARLPAE